MKNQYKYPAVKAAILAMMLSIQTPAITAYAEEFAADSLEAHRSEIEVQVTLTRYKVCVDRAKVYTRPDTKSTVLAVLKQNDGVSVRNIVNGWAEVVISGGTGYMKASDLVRI